MWLIFRNFSVIVVLALLHLCDWLLYCITVEFLWIIVDLFFSYRVSEFYVLGFCLYLGVYCTWNGWNNAYVCVCIRVWFFGLLSKFWIFSRIFLSMKLDLGEYGANWRVHVWIVFCGVLIRILNFIVYCEFLVVMYYAWLIVSY